MPAYGVTCGMFSSCVCVCFCPPPHIPFSLFMCDLCPRGCWCMSCAAVQTPWMVAPPTVMETESVWLDTATASLDSWVLTVPKVRDIWHKG